MKPRLPLPLQFNFHINSQRSKSNHCHHHTCQPQIFLIHLSLSNFSIVVAVNSIFCLFTFFVQYFPLIIVLLFNFLFLSKTQKNKYIKKMVSREGSTQFEDSPRAGPTITRSCWKGVERKWKLYSQCKTQVRQRKFGWEHWKTHWLMYNKS